MRAAEGESGFGAPVTSLFAQINLRQQTFGGQQRPVNAMGKGTRMAKPTMPGVETAAKPNLEWQLLRTAAGLCVSRLNRAAAARRGSAAMTRFKLPKHHLQFVRCE